VAYPSLILTYFGQASWLMHNPEGYSTVFYSCVPAPLFWPVFLISVAAAVVASQVCCVNIT
jgi:KUP system potassium uptake protein